MNKLGIAVLACTFAMALALAGCSGNTAASSSSAAADSGSSTKDVPALDGGWEYQPLDEINLDADAKKIYENGTKDEDAAKYTPVAVLATQLVAGTNYAFLCESDTDTWHIVAIYNDLQDKASMFSDKEIDVANVKSGEVDQPGGDENFAGAWEIVMPEGPAVISETSWIAFDDAMQDYTGLDLVPQATLGSQVVAGMNYRYLCAGQPVVKDPSTSLYIVDVYSDLDGKSQISDVQYFDLLSYIDQ